jgi:uncharacterized protein (AIM24 family)
MIANKIGYANVPATAGQVIKVGPAGLFGIVSTVVGGACTIYDNASAASGNILFTKTLAVGDVIHFGGNGIAANNGLFIVVTGTVNVMFT